MSSTLIKRKYANASTNELISMAVDEGYDSLAYALACRLEQNLQPKLLNHEELEELDNELSRLESSIISMRDTLDVIKPEAT